MISMTVAFGPADGGAWHFLFKSQKTADTAFETLTNVGAIDLVTIEDDYGQRASLASSAIHGVLMENMDLTPEAHIQRGLHQARTQAKANSRGQSDPELKGLAALNGGGVMRMPQRAGN